MSNSSKLITGVFKWIFYLSFALSIGLSILLPITQSFGFYGPPAVPSSLFYSSYLIDRIFVAPLYSIASWILTFISSLLPQMWALEAIVAFVTITAHNLGANGLNLVLIRFILMVSISAGIMFFIRRLSQSPLRKSPARSLVIAFVIVTSLLSCVSIWLTQRYPILIDSSAKSMGLNSSLYIIDIVGRGILGASFSLLLAYLLLEFREGLKRRNFSRNFLNKLKVFSGIVAIILLINFLSILALPLTKGVPFATIMVIPPMIVSVYLFAKTTKVEHFIVEGS